MGWVGFAALVALLLAIDLGIVNRRGHVIATRQAALWTLGWVTLAALFNVGVFLTRGVESGLQFTTGDLIELSLSMDNVFVFIVVLSYFRVPPASQHRVLFWGVLGALILRGIMIGAGSILLARAHWLIYAFGAFLLYTAVKMVRQPEVTVDPATHPVFKVARRLVLLTGDYAGQRFFVRLPDASGRLRAFATPLFVVLLIIESTDVVFALDSIPAIFAVTTDPFIVYTSNVFAILGLRSLYFVLAGAVRRFTMLRPALALVLGFVGLKMLLGDVFPIPIDVSLGVVAGVLSGAAVLSLVRERRAVS
jgi:tellurite resistance protein TerC